MAITKLRAGKYMIPADVTKVDDDYVVKCGYSKDLVAELKVFDKAKWNPANKSWSFPASNRNVFQLMFLEGLNPYEIYDSPLPGYTSVRPLFAHQKQMVAQAIARKHFIWAAEMGTGKTLAAIETMEYCANHYEITKWFWVGSVSALYAVRLEFKKWHSSITPTFSTYESLKRTMRESYFVPQGIIYDECAKIKTPTAQRSVAAFDVAEAIRDKYGSDKSIVGLLSGTPAPKSPLDWWHLCEVACPGFLREGNIHKFRNRMGLITQETGLAGTAYPKLITWWDDENKCATCGLPKEDNKHVMAQCYFKPSVNEVRHLGDRMRGLVQVFLKKDCLDLPEKFYRIIRLEPDVQTLRTAKLIRDTATSVIDALIRLRELSDGFQYEMRETDEKVTCPVCKGSGQINGYVDGMPQLEMCPKCSGTKTINKVERFTREVYSPKDKCLKELLDEFDEAGRVVIYGGFQGTIQKIQKICTTAGWDYIIADGQGWRSSLGGKDPVEMLAHFQSKEIDRIAFIGQPAAGSEGLNLAASPVVIYFSCIYSGGARMQSEDRIHRADMDKVRGATIIDMFHLPSDEKIYESNKAKKELQMLSMVELKTVLGDT